MSESPHGSPDEPPETSSRRDAPAAETAPESAGVPPPRSNPPPPVLRVLRQVLRVLGVAAFAGVLVLSGWLGVETAKRRSTPIPDETPVAADEPRLVLGGAENPLYLSERPSALREFFALHQSPGDRASASLAALPIRRISSPVELALLRTEADAVEVRLLSGPIAGAVYWIHHSQIPEREPLDPIIDPVPR